MHGLYAACQTADYHSRRTITSDVVPDRRFNLDPDRRFSLDPDRCFSLDPDRCFSLDPDRRFSLDPDCCLPLELERGFLRPPLCMATATRVLAAAPGVTRFPPPPPPPPVLSSRSRDWGKGIAGSLYVFLLQGDSIVPGLPYDTSSTSHALSVMRYFTSASEPQPYLSSGWPWFLMIV